MQNHFHQPSIAASLLLALAPCCNAQAESPPARLEAMRKIYEAEIIKRKLPVLQQLVDDLSSLEQRLTKANQLEDAVEARSERTQVGTFKLGNALGFTIRAKSKNQYGILNLSGVTFKPASQQ